MGRMFLTLGEVAERLGVTRSGIEDWHQAEEEIRQIEEQKHEG
jgi:hypothetical protein